MNPGSGVSPTKGATSLLLLSLLQFTRGEAELAGEVNGNVGKCFHESLQREYWVFILFLDTVQQKDSILVP